MELGVITIDHIRERRRAAIVEVGRMLPATSQRRRPPLLGRRAKRVGLVCKELRGVVQPNVGVRLELTDVARAALRRSIEQRVSAGGRGRVKGACRWLG